MFDASRGSLYTNFNTTGSNVRATRYCIPYLYNDRR